METKTEKIIMYDSDQSAKFVTNVSGWVSSTGRFFGKDEHLARYEGSTHKICRCGKMMKKYYTICEDCRNKERIEAYKLLPFKEWDYETPVYSHYADEYFYDEDGIFDYCADEELGYDELRLVICEPNHFHQIDTDLWSDILPENTEYIPKELTDAIDVLNKVIHKLPVASWSPGKVRTEYKPELS